MPMMKGPMSMYMGNMKGSFGTMNPSGGNATKAPKGRGRKGLGSGMGNAASSPKRGGGGTVNPMR